MKSFSAGENLGCPCRKIIITVLEFLLTREFGLGSDCVAKKQTKARWFSFQILKRRKQAFGRRI